MNKDLFFKASDGWLFTTIYNMKKLWLESIIKSGDTLNHAIFSLDEINDGLSRLESEEFIEIIDSHLKLKEKAKAFIKCNKKRFEGCINEQVRYSSLFSKMPLSQKVVYKKYFSSEEYELEVEKYTK